LPGECPECKKRNSHKAKACKCGFALAKFSGRVYWIDYLVHGQRRRVSAPIRKRLTNG